MKKKYMKPSFRVVELRHKCQILANSGEPKRDVPWWEGEAGTRRHKSVWDDEDEWEEEQE